MRRVLILMLIAGCLWVDSAEACCNAPDGPGLWPTIEEADMIVVARVEGIDASRINKLIPIVRRTREVTVGLTELFSEDLATALDDNLPRPPVDPTFKAQLKVIETLKGPPHSRLSILHGISCFFGGYFIPGETIVAFLDEGTLHWETLPWINSTLYSHRPSDLAQLIDIVRKAVALQESSLTDPSDRQQWAWDTVSSSATRQFAQEELTHVSPDRLAEAFVNRPSIDASMAQMLRLLAKYSDEAVDQAAVVLIESWMNGDQASLWQAREALPLVAQRLGVTFDETTRRGAYEPAEILRIWNDLLVRSTLEVQSPGHALTIEIAALSAWKVRSLDEYSKAYSF